MNKKKILFIDHEYRCGGAELSMIDLVNSVMFSKNIHPIALIGGSGEFNDKLQKLGLKNIFFRKFESWRWWETGLYSRIKLFLSLPIQIISVFHLVFFYRKLKPDIIHLNTSRLVIPLIAAKLSGYTTIIHFRELPRVNNSFFGGLKFLFKILRISDYWIANSYATCNSLLDYKKKKKIEVIYNGIDSVKFSNTSKIRKPFNVIMMATLEPWKNIELFIDIASNVVKSKKNINFLIAGKGNQNYKQALENKIKTKKIQNNVKFIGYVEDTPKLLNSSHIMLHTSGSETFGRVFVEAMLTETPVIALSGGASNEIISDKVTGYVFDEHEIDYVVRTILNLHADSLKRSKIGELARKRALEYFSIKKLQYSINNFYDGLKIR